MSNPHLCLVIFLAKLKIGYTYHRVSIATNMLHAGKYPPPPDAIILPTVDLSLNYLVPIKSRIR